MRILYTPTSIWFSLGKSSSIASRLRNNPNSIGGFNPTSRRKRESIQTSLFSKPLEFEGVKIWVVKSLPVTQIFLNPPSCLYLQKVGDFFQNYEIIMNYGIRITKIIIPWASQFATKAECGERLSCFSYNS